MHVSDANAHSVEVFRQHLRHSLGKRRYERPVALLSRLPYLAEKIIDLACDGPYDYLGIHKTGRPDYLLRDLRCVRELVFGGCCANANKLVHAVFEFVECQWAVVVRARYPETVFDKFGFA